MYKKFIISTIKRAIETEFGYRCLLAVEDNINIIPAFSDETFIAFYFDTIFEDVHVHGFIDCGRHLSWEENSDYRLIKEYYREDCQRRV